MKVLLLQDTTKIGSRGEIREVNDGFARNFLFPKQIAVLAMPEAVLRWKIEAEKERRLAEDDLKQTQEMGAQLDRYELEIKAKAGEDGKLYGGIGSQKIVEELKKRHFKVSKDQVIIPEPIKTLGEHRVMVKFKHGLESEVIIIVKNLK